MSTAPQPRPRRLAPEIRRAQLLDAALDVVAEEGFDAVTVEAVAARAGVTRPVIYDMFGDLEGLLLALIDREEVNALAPLLGIVGGDPGDADPEQFLHDAILAFLRAVRESPRTWRLVLMPPRGSSRELRERIRRSRRLVAGRVTELLDWGVAARGGPFGLDHAAGGAADRRRRRGRRPADARPPPPLRPRADGRGHPGAARAAAARFRARRAPAATARPRAAARRPTAPDTQRTFVR